MANGPTFREWCLDEVEKLPILDGRFEQMRRIDARGGNGNFSLMFQARDNHTNRTVALKFFNPESLRDLYRLQSFEREADLISKISARHDVVRLLSPRSQVQIAIPGSPVVIPFNYYPLELAVSNVREAIAAHRWDPLQKIKVFGAMCRGVQRSHRSSVAHRDLKPDHFLILATGQVKLCDFGAARDITSPPVVPDYSGPPGDLRYCAPEMLACLHGADPAMALGADFFALGANLFELFTGSVLTSHIYDPNFVTDLMTLVGSVPAAARGKVYDSIVPGIAAARPLPALVSLAPSMPSSIADHVQQLYERLASLDYRSRMVTFEPVFARIARCLRILRRDLRLAERERRKSASRLARR